MSKSTNAGKMSYCMPYMRVPSTERVVGVRIRGLHFSHPERSLSGENSQEQVGVRMARCRWV